MIIETTIKQIAEHYGNADDDAIHTAVLRDYQGEAAFWHKDSEPTDDFRAFLMVANMCSLPGAITEGYENELDVWLEMLIPMNEAAVKQLSAAYSNHLNTWTTHDEIRRRRTIVEDASV